MKHISLFQFAVSIALSLISLPISCMEELPSTVPQLSAELIQCPITCMIKDNLVKMYWDDHILQAPTTFHCTCTVSDDTTSLKIEESIVDHISRIFLNEEMNVTYSSLRKTFDLRKEEDRKAYMRYRCITHHNVPSKSVEEYLNKTEEELRELEKTLDYSISDDYETDAFDTREYYPNEERIRFLRAQIKSVKKINAAHSLFNQITKNKVIPL